MPVSVPASALRLGSVTGRAAVVVAVAVAVVAVAACNTADIVVGDLHEVTVLRAVLDRELDLLFVIDNSPSMADKQAALAASFPRMVDKLAQLDGGLPDLHIGVITSDMGTQGASGAIGPAIGVPGLGGCSGVGDDGALQHAGLPALVGSFLSDVPDGSGGRVRNYDGDLRDAVAALVRVGAAGCGFEQHLAALRRSLGNPANAGFARPEANLAIVILADEDDCSMLDPALLGPDAALGPLTSFRCFEQGVICDPDAPRTPGDKRGCRPRDHGLVEPAASFIAAVLAAKPDPRRVMVAGIVGDPAPVAVAVEAAPGAPAFPTLAPSCVFDTAATARADPAVRLAAFLDGFPGRTERTSICSTDLAAPLDAIGATAKRLVGDPCIDTTALADTSVAPGIQPACDVFDTRDSAADQPVPLPPCDGDTATDCFTITPDAITCPAGDDHLRVRLRHAATVAADTWTHVRCQRAQ
jgi:hypothetical protein